MKWDPLADSYDEKFNSHKVPQKPARPKIQLIREGRDVPDEEYVSLWSKFCSAIKSIIIKCFNPFSSPLK